VSEAIQQNRIGVETENAYSLAAVTADGIVGRGLHAALSGIIVRHQARALHPQTWDNKIITEVNQGVRIHQSTSRGLDQGKSQHKARQCAQQLYPKARETSYAALEYR
jgi:hypothetical protein